MPLRSGLPALYSRGKNHQFTFFPFAFLSFSFFALFVRPGCPVTVLVHLRSIFSRVGLTFSLKQTFISHLNSIIMFAKFASLVVIALSALSTGVSAASIPVENTDIVARGSPRHFDNYGGFSSMSNFDNFYGYGNFDNSQFSSSSITIVQEQELVCHSQSIEIIQQRLLVLQEMAKRVITEQICEVETQTIVFEQFHSSLHGFSRDLRRYSGRGVGYDSQISSHFSDFFESDGSLSTSDFGFSGHDLGRSYVSPSGNNWSSRSRVSVNSAYSGARSAVHSF